MCGFGAGLSVRFGSVLRFLAGFGSGVYPFASPVCSAAAASVSALLLPLPLRVRERVRVCVRMTSLPLAAIQDQTGRRMDEKRKNSSDTNKRRVEERMDEWMDGWGGACPRGEEDEEEGRCSGGRQIGQCIIMMNSV